MIVGIGNDVVEIQRVEKACQKEAFLIRTFTQREIELCVNSTMLADNYAVKEAVSKAFGTGISGFRIIDIEVLRDELGKPYVCLHGGAKELANSKEIKNLLVSISNTKTTSYAIAIAEN